jgi:hypothetical protein
MPHRLHEPSEPRELSQGATLGLPLRGLSCPGSEPRDSEPPLEGALRSPDPKRPGAGDGRGAAADPRPGGAALSHEVPTSGPRKPPPSPRARERILVAMLGLALAAVLVHAARRATAIDTHIGRRSR